MVEGDRNSCSVDSALLERLRTGRLAADGRFCTPKSQIMTNNVAQRGRQRERRGGYSGV